MNSKEGGILVNTSPEKNNNFLWEKYLKDNDKDAYEELIRSYMPLVDKVVYKMLSNLSTFFTKDDLQSYGLHGLADAINKFDYTKQLKFETYAHFRIRGAILDEIRKMDRVPRSIREKAKKIDLAISELEQKKLKSISLQELSEYLQIPISEIEMIINETNQNLISLDDFLFNEDVDNLYQFIEDKYSSIEYKLNEFFLKEELTMAIEKLGEKERLVVTLHYYEELTFSEIAAILEVTPSRVSQIHSKALNEMRKYL